MLVLLLLNMVNPSSRRPRTSNTKLTLPFHVTAIPNDVGIDGNIKASGFPLQSEWIEKTLSTAMLELAILCAKTKTTLATLFQWCLKVLRFSKATKFQPLFHKRQTPPFFASHDLLELLEA